MSKNLPENKTVSRSPEDQKRLAAYCSLKMSSASSMTEPMTSGEPEQPERPIGNGVSNGRCSKGWPAFWLVVVCGTASTVINALVLPAFSTAFFNGGTNPCIDEGHASAACKEALKKAERIGSNFTVLGAVCVFFTSPNIALLCDRFGRKLIMILGQVAGFLSVLSLVAVDIFGISLYVYYASWTTTHGESAAILHWVKIECIEGIHVQ